MSLALINPVTPLSVGHASSYAQKAKSANSVNSPISALGQTQLSQANPALASPLWYEASRVWSRIPLSDRNKKVLESVNNIFRSISQQDQRGRLSAALAKVEKIELASFITEVSPYLCHHRDAYVVADIIHLFKLIPKAQRVNAAEKLVDSLKRVKLGYQRKDILRALELISSHQRVEVFDSLILFFTDQFRQEHRDEIVAHLEVIQEKDRGPVVLLTALFIDQLKTGLERGIFLEALSLINEQKRKKTSSSLARLFSVAKPQEQRKLTAAIETMPPDERGNLIQLTDRFVPLTPSVLKVAARYHYRVLHLLSLLDKSERPQTEIFFKVLRLPTLYFLRPILHCIAPAKRFQALKNLHSEITRLGASTAFHKFGTLVSLLFQDLEVKTASLAFIKACLDSYSDRYAALRVARFALEARGPLGLDMQHPLIQRAIEVQIPSNHDYNLREKDPYTVYGKLKDILDSEKLLDLTAQTSYLVEPNSCIGEINPKAMTVSVTLKGFREHANRKKLTFKDLEQYRGPNSKHKLGLHTMQDLFYQLELRLENTSGEAKQKLQHAIDLTSLDTTNFNSIVTIEDDVIQPLHDEDEEKNDDVEERDNVPKQTPHSLSTLERLKASTIAGACEVDYGFERDIPIMLRADGRPDDPIDNALLALYAILYAIKELPTSRHADELLSPQEQLFLAFCNFIRDCSKGQKEGCIRFHNDILQPSQRSNVCMQLNEPGEIIIQNIVEAEMQIFLDQLLSGDTILRNLLGLSKEDPLPKDTEKQLEHQSGLLKNRFYKQMGLVQNLEFDHFTCCIDDKLLALLEPINLASNPMSGSVPHAALRTIINSILPKDLIRHVKRTIQITYDNNAETEQHLSKFFRINRLDKSKDLEIRRYIQYEENEDCLYTFTGLTDEGALEILRAMGYVSVQAIASA